MLNRAQKFSFEDQRGPLDTKNLKVPEFLLTNNLIKSQSLNQNIDTSQLSFKTNNAINGTQSFNYTKSEKTQLKKNNLMSTFNESTSSLPVYSSTNSKNSTKMSTSDLVETKTFISRSRSPMIVYDNEEENIETLRFKKSQINQNSSYMDESCVIDNSITGYERSTLSTNNQNSSSSFMYDAEQNVIHEENVLDNKTQNLSESLLMNNSILSLNCSPAKTSNIQSDSFRKSNSKINSRISYV